GGGGDARDRPSRSRGSSAGELGGGGDGAAEVPARSRSERAASWAAKPAHSFLSIGVRSGRCHRGAWGGVLACARSAPGGRSGLSGGTDEKGGLISPKAIAGPPPAV